MARIAGRNARAYINISSGGTAEPLAFMASWDLNQTSDRYEVTAFGDTSKTYVAGLPDAQGNLAGFFDSATPQMYSAAVDGVARKTYLYPDIVGSPALYWFGTAFLDFSITVPVAGSVEVSGSFAAATGFQKVG